MNDNNDIMGLVLAGGRSQRMGMDKGMLQYHGKPQREYLYEQLEPICSRVFLSIRPEQEGQPPQGTNVNLD